MGSALPARPIGSQCHSHGSVEQPCSQVLGHGLALEALGGGILVPYSQTKEASPFETEEKLDLPSGPVVGVAALSSLNPFWGQSPFFLKDNSCLKLDNSIVLSCRIPEV